MTEDKETARIEAFSDSVFAIASTLLVLEITVPSHERVAANGLARSLAALWPSYLAFLTSFLTILDIWVHHHWIFTLIKRNDHPFLYLNGLLLLCVTFVPFPTALLAEYLLHPDAHVAANLYTGTFLAISLAFHALWRYASTRLLPTDATSAKRNEAAQFSKQYRFGPAALFRDIRGIVCLGSVERWPVLSAGVVFRTRGLARQKVACEDSSPHSSRLCRT